MKLELIKKLDLRPKIKSKTMDIVAGAESEISFSNKYGEVGYWAYGTYNPNLPLNEDTELGLGVLIQHSS